jgi:hypothetical protein
MKHECPGAHIAAQVPPLQQPPLQLASAPHAVEHVPKLHAWFIGQSLAWKHVHWFMKQACPFAVLQSPPPLQPQPPPTHWSPSGDVMQLVHEAPHVAGFVSSAHMPPEQQKPVPHVPSPVAPHALTQAPMLLHVGVWPPQGAHVAPVEPQASFAAPAWQLLPSQQPPWHVRPPAHDVWHT